MNIAISACFFTSCERSWKWKYKREDFKDLFKVDLDVILKEWHQVFEYKSKKIIFICPENLAWLGTPRIPAEIEPWKTWDDVIKWNWKVITKEGKDETILFLAWAKRALDICKKYDVWIYIAKNKSPSCWVVTYDWTFSWVLDNFKSWVIVSYFKSNWIKVIPDTEVDYNRFLSIIG